LANVRFAAPIQIAVRSIACRDIRFADFLNAASVTPNCPKGMRSSFCDKSKRYIITIADDDRGPLDKLCQKLIAAGGACDVLRNSVR